MALTSIQGDPQALVPVEITLFVEIDYYDGSFSYRYSENDYVLVKGQQVRINLDSTRTPPGSNVHFVGFSSTSPFDLPLAEPIDSSTGRPYEHGIAFAAGTDQILLTLNSDYGELVKFGTHVRCEFTDISGKPKSYTKLCDPQIGNGPP